MSRRSRGAGAAAARLATWQAFADRDVGLKRDLHATLAQLGSQGKSVGGYGAPAKGNTLLSFLDLGPDDLD